MRLPVILIVIGVVAACGCAMNPLKKTAGVGPASLEPPPGVAAPAHTLAPPAVSMQPSFVDSDPRQLEAGLTRSRQESQLMQEEITALREQLASTSSQLAVARSVAGPPAAAGGIAQAVPGVMTPAAMQASMARLALPDADVRLDGSVVRIEIPADRLFEGDTANLLPGGAAILTLVSTEIERVYPGHFLGIEGHTDTEPLHNASWGSPHQLSAARASAVFDFFIDRTSLRQSQLFLVAHGPNHPVVSNATAAGRARNRRIEFVVYPEAAGAGGGATAEPTTSP
jgi:hypothetical protein